MSQFFTTLFGRCIFLYLILNKKGTALPRMFDNFDRICKNWHRIEVQIIVYSLLSYVYLYRDKLFLKVKIKLKCVQASKPEA